jgi:hypothetical protein
MLAIFTFHSLDPYVHELSEMATNKGIYDRLRDIYSERSPAKNYESFHSFVLTVFVISEIIIHRKLKLLLKIKMQSTWKGTVTAS